MSSGAGVHSKKIRFSSVNGEDDCDETMALRSPRTNRPVVAKGKKPNKNRRVRIASWKYWTPSWAYKLHISLWIIIALVLLLLSNILLLVCFVTNGWAVLHVEASNTTFGADPHHSMDWHFGLWQCCRSDGFCLGPRWPGRCLHSGLYRHLGIRGSYLPLGIVADTNL